MSKHFELIFEYCDVVKVIGDTAIFFFEDGFGYAEINGVSYSCYSIEEFDQLIEQFGEDDEEDILACEMESLGGNWW